MTNYIPARLSCLPDDEPVMPVEDERDYNPEQEQMDEGRIFNELFENDLYERMEGFGL